MTRAIPLLILVHSWLSAQPIPKFEDYPAGPVYRGKPAGPKLVTEGGRLFRTRIRQGAAAGPVFAGHIAVARWDCGSACLSMALIDSEF